MTDVPAHGDQSTHARASSSVALPRASHSPIGHVSTVGMLLPVRIFLAAGWLRAGAEKLIEPEWWHGTALRDFSGWIKNMALGRTADAFRHEMMLTFFAGYFRARVSQPRRPTPEVRLPTSDAGGRKLESGSLETGATSR